MVVNRSANQAGPATLTVYFRNSVPSPSAPAVRSGDTAAFSSSAPQPVSSATPVPSVAPVPAADERVVTIDMRHQRSDAILDEFLRKTGAVPVVPTQQEEAEARDLRQRDEQAEVDREVMRKHLAAERREKALLAQAREEASALKHA